MKATDTIIALVVIGVVIAIGWYFYKNFKGVSDAFAGIEKGATNVVNNITGALGSAQKAIDQAGKDLQDFGQTVQKDASNLVQTVSKQPVQIVQPNTNQVVTLQSMVKSASGDNVDTTSSSKNSGDTGKPTPPTPGININIHNVNNNVNNSPPTIVSTVFNPETGVLVPNEKVVESSSEPITITPKTGATSLDAATIQSILSANSEFPSTPVSDAPAQISISTGEKAPSVPQDNEPSSIAGVNVGSSPSSFQTIFDNAVKGLEGLFAGDFSGTIKPVTPEIVA